MLGRGQYKVACTGLHKLCWEVVRPRVGTGCAVPWRSTRLASLARREVLRIGTWAQASLWSWVVVAVKPEGQRLGRVRLGRGADAPAARLEPFVQAAAQPGTTMCMDGWPRHGRLRALGCRHEVTVRAGTSTCSTPSFRPCIQWSQLKRWLLGTQHGAVSPQHPDYNLDAFTFRFNLRRQGSRGPPFRRLLNHTMQVDPTPASARPNRPVPDGKLVIQTRSSGSKDSQAIASVTIHRRQIPIYAPPRIAMGLGPRLHATAPSSAQCRPLPLHSSFASAPFALRSPPQEPRAAASHHPDPPLGKPVHQWSKLRLCRVSDKEGSFEPWW